MKKIILLLIFLPVIAQAQHWQIGLSTGLSVNSKFDEFIESNNTRLTLSGAVMISASRRLSPKFDIGLALTAVDLVRIANSISIYNQVGSGTYYDARMHMGKMGMLITPFVSYRMHHFYIGAQGGYFTSFAGDNEYSPDKTDLYFNNLNGFSIGLHVGHDWPVSRNFLISAEIRGNYVEASVQHAYGFNTYEGAFLVGAKYAFGFATPRHPKEDPGPGSH